MKTSFRTLSRTKIQLCLNTKRDYGSGQGSTQREKTCISHSFIKHRHLLPAAILLVIVAGCRSLPPVPPAHPACRPADGRVKFFSFVCHAYPTGGQLDGWVNTGIVVEKTCHQWFSGGSSEWVLDPSRSELKEGLTRAVNHAEADLVVIYLGIRQDKQGRGILVDGETVDWDALFPEQAPTIQEAQRTFFILDGCHAGATLTTYPRLREFGTWLVACEAGELVLQRDLKKRRGYDFRRRHPQAWAAARQWLCPPFRVSHTGLVWAAAIENPLSAACRSPSDLRHFFLLLQSVGNQIDETSKLSRCTVPRLHP